MTLFSNSFASLQVYKGQEDTTGTAKAYISVFAYADKDLKVNTIGSTKGDLKSSNAKIPQEKIKKTRPKTNNKGQKRVKRIK